MNTNKNKVIIAAFSLLLNAPYTMIIQSAHAQNSDHARLPISSQQLALEDQVAQLDREAAIALHTGRYVEAEAAAREAVKIDPFQFGIADEILAESLMGQNKDQEAIVVYYGLSQGNQARNLLPYAQLLLKSGRWAQAVAVYNQALPFLGHEELEQITSHFSPDVPQPEALAIAIHLERGQLYNTTPNWVDGAFQNTEAMAEYQKALQLAPDNALTNYYYGVGWHKLSPTDRVKFGTAQQAKAALQKAVKIGNANVKAAALKALKSAG